MGRKKYYCDYCDKSINADITTRTKHLASFNHIRLREEHYIKCKDPAVILEEESKKKPCRYLETSGECRFGSSCRFSHFSQEELDRLRNSIEVPKYNKSLPLFNEWISREVKMDQNSSKPLSYQAVNLPANLPPSLQPFDVIEYLDRDLDTW